MSSDELKPYTCLKVEKKPGSEKKETEFHYTFKARGGSKLILVSDNRDEYFIDDILLVSYDLKKIPRQKTLESKF